MRVSLGLTFIVVALATTVSASEPFVPCKVAKVDSLGRTEGITFKRVTFLESYGEVGAWVFVPESQTPVPAIVFAYSSIHGPNNSADLNRFALALARAGAASIVLDGAIEWQTPNDNNRRPAHVMSCAGQWLLLNERLDEKHLATAGPTKGWGGGDTPFCLQGERPCWKGIAWATFGQTSSAELHNTYALLTPKGRLGMARFFQKQLGLSEVKPAWLAEPEN